ncbi:MAG: Gfo/Idh/MocA family protein [Phycisphaerae bacterium]
MTNEPLPVAVIGTGGFGENTLRALTKMDSVKIVGVSDRRGESAERAAGEARTEAFTDNRSLLAETRPAAVFLAVPPPAAGDIITACAKRGIHVWKELPLARNLGEGLEFVRRMETAESIFAVGTQRRFATGYGRARELQSWLGQLFLARAHYLFNWGPELGWRADRSAGGGALLELGYHLVDLLVSMLGLPEEVYGSGVCGANCAGRSLSPTPYDTEDTAAALLRFRDGCMGSMVTTRVSGPVSEGLSLHGSDGSVLADSETCIVRDPDGNVLDRVGNDQTAPLDVFRRLAEHFVTAVRTGAKRYECSGWENLLNLAVIDALYLSERTSQPESPARLLDTHGIEAEQCLAHRPSPLQQQRPDRQSSAEPTDENNVAD